MSEVERLAAKTMELIFNEYIEYQKCDINITEFLVRRYNIIVKATYLNGLGIRPSEFLDTLGFDLIHEAEVIRDLVQ